MKYIILSLLVVFLKTEIVNADNKLILGVGKNHIISIKSGSTVHVSDSKVLQVRDLGGRLSVIGKKPGSSMVSANKTEYEFTVLDDNQYDFYLALQSLIKTMMGIKLEIIEQNITATGELLRFSDWTKILHLAESYHAKWLLNAKMSADVEHEARIYFQNKIFENQLPSPSLVIQPEPTALILKENEPSKTRYLNLLKGSGFKIEVSSDSVNILPVVEIAVQIAELKKSEFSRIGMLPPAGVSGTVTGSLNLNIDPAQFAVTLNAMQTKGDAKVLANPRLICRSGKEAQFLAGGEFPIKIFNFKMSDIQWKKHGIVLSVKPNADGRGRMSLYVSAEISLIDTAQTVEGVPGLLVNRVDTYIDLTKSKTIALSGLIKQDWGKSRTGLPVLSEIPLLNLLFSSEDFRNEQTDLVIFLTPKVLDESDG